MKWFERERHKAASRSRGTIDAFSFLFSYYAVPVAIGILSLFALLYPAETTAPGDDMPLFVRALSDPAGQLDAARAASELDRQTWADRYDTHRSEKPVWLEIAIPHPEQPGGASAAAPVLSEAVLFPSRHIQQISCFDGSTLAPLGDISPSQDSSGELSRAGSGIAIAVNRHDQLLCRARFSGPAVFTAVRLSSLDLKERNDMFFRRAGLLEGGLATLAAFVFIAAMINRDWVYVLFAAWLIGNLRLGAISMGWDGEWFGYPLTTDWVLLIRKVTVPVYYILTYTLFHTLFKAGLVKVGYKGLLATVQWLGLILLVGSIVLPVPMYLPMMWAIASFGIGVLVFLLGRLLIVSPSRMALWYCASLATALVASFSEIASAAFGHHFFIPNLNSVTAALVSSLMAALAIAEQIRAERAERMQAQAELRLAYEVTPVGLFTLGPDGSFVRFNSALQTMLGMGRDKRGRHWDDYFEPGSWQPIYRLATQTGEVECELSHDRSLPALSGPKSDSAVVGDSVADYDESVGADAAPNGDRRHYLVKAAVAGLQLEGSVQDITERQQAIHVLSFLADHDPLTGALNRRGVDKHIKDTMAASGPGSAPLIIAYLDLDRFKLINDLFGHHIGDEVLKQACARIEAKLGPLDRVCRIGGDEFVILFGETTISEATVFAQAIIDAIDATPYHIGRRAFRVRASLGLIEPPPGLPSDDAISAADAACREAKQNGKGRVVVYTRDAPMFGERAGELSLIERFSGELPVAGLFLEMQPIMSLTDPYESLDFEVLLRMRAPDGTVVSPTKVVSAAEANGTISALDKWVMETTLSWIDRNRAKLPRTHFVSVNVSGASLNDERFVVEVGELLARYSVLPLLCIEITEGVALHDLDNTRRLVASVQRLGARVALDDFGAGYTSFPYLRDLPVDALKIDGGFVRNMNDFSANAAIVEAMIGLARNLGIQTIAEWVEDAHTLQTLQGMRVDYVQGFAIARPQSPDVILAAHSAADFIHDPAVLALIGPNTSSTMLGDNSPVLLH